MAHGYLKTIQTETTMKTKTTPIALALLALLSSIGSAAPMGTAFTYQGHLTDGTNPANGSYEFRLALYNAVSGPAAVGEPLTNAVVGVTNGGFTLALDFGAGAFNGEARWLEIAVRTNGSAADFTLLSPRQALTPTPYSLHAANAGLFSGQSATAFAPASGSPAYVAKTGDTLTGALNLPANGLAVGGNQLALSGGNVGVGTANPAAKLHVLPSGPFDGIKIGAVDTTGATSLGLSLSSPTSGYADIQAVRSQNVAWGDIVLNRQGGNVGIGTINPGAKLQVAGSGFMESGLRVGGSLAPNLTGAKAFYAWGPLYDSVSYQNAAIGGSMAYDGTNYVVGTDGASDGGWMVRGIGNGGSLGFYTIPYVGSDIQTIAPSTIESYRRMTIDSTGIQVAGPRIQLGLITNGPAGSPGYGATLCFSGGPDVSDVFDSDNSDGLWMARYNAADNQSELRLNIGDDRGSWQDQFVVGVSDQEGWHPRLAVSGNGSVGIGTTSPAAMLEVAGTVKATAYQGDGSALTGITGSSVVSGQVVKSLNGLRDQVTVSGGANVSVTTSGNGIQISATPGTVVTNGGWSLSGNSGTTADNFLGTRDGQPLELRVHNTSGLRLEYGAYSNNNVIGGSGNSVASGVAGATIGGGGRRFFRLPNNWLSDPNIVQGDFGTISGGFHNTASGYAATIPGGQGNIAAGTYSFAAGYAAKALHDGAFVWNDSQGLALASTAPDQFLVRASGGVGLFGNVELNGNLHLNGALSGDLRLNDHDLWFRGGSDRNHGLGWFGGGGRSFGGVQVDGPVLYGWYDGALGSTADGEKATLYWTHWGEVGMVGIGTNNPQTTLHVNGTARVNVLQIEGGADVAEPFELSDNDIPKGAVVVIDEANPGRLKLSDRAYDTRVAGIVSGANGIQPGVTLRQRGVMDSGQNVALSGRVYVQADASTGAIKPGDALTTSEVPGHAMIVTDHAQAQGAILGKAMTTLEKGRGLVLVLVTLQ